MKSILLLLLRFYQLAISPILGPSCRFYPSCSEYAVEAVRVHGALKGSALAGRRLCKCHPWHPGGLDFVPEAKNAATNAAAISATNAVPNSSTTPSAAHKGCSHS